MATGTLCLGLSSPASPVRPVHPVRPTLYALPSLPHSLPACFCYRYRILSAMNATTGSGSADSFAPASFLGLLSVTFTASMLALLSKSVHSMDRKFSYTTLRRCTYAICAVFCLQTRILTAPVAISICIIATLFVAVISAFAVGSCVNLSQEICRAAYTLCAAFWLVGKGLLYLWYTEKVPPPPG